mgnify:CR=1 FL=1
MDKKVAVCGSRVDTYLLSKYLSTSNPITMKKYLLPLCLCFMLFSCTEKKEETAVISYPVSQKGDVVDDYFGTQVPDPYRWMENDTSQATADWVASQNETTFSYLENIPYRNDIKKRLEEVYNYERLSAPFKEGDYYYFYKNDGLQNHSVLYRKKGEDGIPEVFLNPNEFSTGISSKLVTS